MRWQPTDRSLIRDPRARVLRAHTMALMALDLLLDAALETKGAGLEIDWQPACYKIRALIDEVEAAARERPVYGEPTAEGRDYWGQVVREAWLEWARTQGRRKPGWLVPYEGLSEAEREVDRQIAEAVLDRVRKLHEGPQPA